MRGLEAVLARLAMLCDKLCVLSLAVKGKLNCDDQGMMEYVLRFLDRPEPPFYTSHLLLVTVHSLPLVSELYSQPMPSLPNGQCLRYG